MRVLYSQWVPTVLRNGPYRFFFYSSDRGEAPHIHVERDRQLAKFWLTPVRLQESVGFRAPELLRIEQLVAENLDELLGAWDGFFGD